MAERWRSDAILPQISEMDNDGDIPGMRQSFSIDDINELIYDDSRSAEERVIDLGGMRDIVMEQISADGGNDLRAALVAIEDAIRLLSDQFGETMPSAAVDHNPEDHSETFSPDDDDRPIGGSGDRDLLGRDLLDTELERDELDDQESLYPDLTGEAAARDPDRGIMRGDPIRAVEDVESRADKLRNSNLAGTRGDEGFVILEDGSAANDRADVIRAEDQNSNLLASAEFHTQGADEALAFGRRDLFYGQGNLQAGDVDQNAPVFDSGINDADDATLRDEPQEDTGLDSDHVSAARVYHTVIDDVPVDEFRNQAADPDLGPNLHAPEGSETAFEAAERHFQEKQRQERLAREREIADMAKRLGKQG